MNKPQLSIGIFFALLACVSGAKARIGETLRECEARYGSPIELPPTEAPAEEKRIYRKGDFFVVIWFLHHKAASITFCKSDKSAIPELDCVSLLNANGGSPRAVDWETINNNPDSEVWISLDHSIFAIYDKERLAFNVCTGEYHRALVAVQEATRKQKLEGF